MLTDYGAPNAWAQWGWDDPIHDAHGLAPDVMTFSHTHHEDHYDASRIPPGVSRILTGTDSLEMRGVRIEPVLTGETEAGGKENTSFVFHYRGQTLVHLGDCQGDIMACEAPEVRRRLQKAFPKHIDLLLMPIQSTKEFIPRAVEFLSVLKPRLAVPMHYWSLDYKAAFLAAARAAGYPVEEPGMAVYTLEGSGSDAGVTRVVVLEPAPHMRF